MVLSGIHRCLALGSTSPLDWKLPESWDHVILSTTVALVSDTVPGTQLKLTYQARSTLKKPAYFKEEVL